MHGLHSVNIQMMKWIIREVMKIELHPVNMIRESGYVGMLFRTVNEQQKYLWRVTVTHFSSAHNPSKDPCKVSCLYIQAFYHFMAYISIGAAVAQTSLHHL